MRADDAEVVVAGAGPSGAATALLMARSGHHVLVLDRARFPRDKACGEGLMPSGVAVLRRLGVLDAVLEQGAPHLHGVTYRMAGPDGPIARAAFPQPPGGGPAWGLGVRRCSFDAVLVDALRAEPRVRLLEGVRAAGLRRDGEGRVRAVVTAEGESLTTRLVVAADGLHSALRKAAGWTAPGRHLARYGLAGHWRLDSRAISGITVSLAGDHEWYQAPVGPDELLVSVLADRQRVGMIATDYAGAARGAIPLLAGAEPLGPPLAAGLFQQGTRRIAGGGLFLVGDAAGYDDPTTGEGIGISLLLAERLSQRLQALLAGSLSPPAAAAAYARDHRGLWRERRRVTRLALAMARHPGAARRAITRLSGRPRALEVLLGINCGYWGFTRLTVRDWISLAGL
jgi:2-polyprenyl-6-methoxyphenol hydroxylase-like FAD-dependent oxidoreductase